jgi:redox-sensitive bicupin YhaK (pirin superfamily)
MASDAGSYIVLDPEDHVVIGQAQFGMPGLTAIEAIGPFAAIQASGPLITVHDSTIEAGLGIGHHPHRFNERLFYIEQGELDHDDSLNGITGHMDAGDVGQFTEGRRGMVHSEWNHGPVETRAYILVYSTEPVPDQTAFNALREEDAPRYQEGAGVRTKELVGPQSPLRVNGDIRLFADSRVDPGGTLAVQLAAGEGAVISVRDGAVRMEDRELSNGTSLVVPPADQRRGLQLHAVQPSRLMRVVHGPGHGFVRRAASARRNDE